MDNTSKNMNQDVDVCMQFESMNNNINCSLRQQNANNKNSKVDLKRPSPLSQIGIIFRILT